MQEINLKEYLDSKIHSLHSEINVKIESLKDATTLARTTMDERLARMNEFRDTLRDQNATFVTREEHNALIKSIDDKFFLVTSELNSKLDKIEDNLRILNESKAKLEGKADQSQVNIALIISIVSIMIGIIGFLIRLGAV